MATQKHAKTWADEVDEADGACLRSTPQAVHIFVVVTLQSCMCCQRASHLHRQPPQFAAVCEPLHVYPVFRCWLDKIWLGKMSSWVITDPTLPPWRFAAAAGCAAHILAAEGAPVLPDESESLPQPGFVAGQPIRQPDYAYEESRGRSDSSTAGQQLHPAVDGRPRPQGYWDPSSPSTSVYVSNLPLEASQQEVAGAFWRALSVQVGHMAYLSAVFPVLAWPGS